MKLQHLIPCCSSLDAPEFARLFFQHVFKLQGLPDTVILDRGPKFVANYCEILYSRLQTERGLLRSYYSQTDRQTERVNALAEQYLSGFVSYLQDDWEYWLALAEFSENNAASETTSMLPFFVNYCFGSCFNTDLLSARLDEYQHGRTVA